MTAPRRCKDCETEGVPTRRAAPHPGPRCHTHYRARRTQTRDTAWEKRLVQLYDINADEYWEIYEFQGGRCYICRRGNGSRKKLSVDHCHKTGVVRGLLDTGCNKWVLGMLRDDPEAFQRAIDYLLDPPAVQVIGKRIAPIEADRLTLDGESDAP